MKGPIWYIFYMHHYRQPAYVINKWINRSIHLPSAEESGRYFASRYFWVHHTSYVNGKPVKEILHHPISHPPKVERKKETKIKIKQIRRKDNLGQEEFYIPVNGSLHGIWLNLVHPSLSKHLWVLHLQNIYLYSE